MIKTINKQKTNSQIKAAKKLSKVIKSDRNPCNYKLEGKREQICYEYFNDIYTVTELAFKYGVINLSIVNTIKKWGVSLGYISHEDLYARKNKFYWKVKSEITTSV